MSSLVALVGSSFRPKGTLELVASLPHGEPLILRRDPENDHDPFAVEVWAKGQHIGFVKATQAPPIARRMDAAAMNANVNVRSLELPAKLAIKGGKWPMVEID